MARAKTVLLVDADHAAAKYAEQILESEGYRVLVARDGDEALAKLRDTSADVIVIEILLPQKNGYQLCRALKADPATQAVPVLFVSVKSQPSDRFWAKRVGGNGFVAKPFDPADLLRELHALLQDQGQPA